MRPRILLNLAAFVVLGIVLIIWALTSIVSVDAINKPFTVTAEFEASPGLRSDLEVAYLGVKVGSVDAVKLEPGKVVVKMHLDRGTRVPSNVDAAVLRKSAVGEPYIEMSPPAGAAARPLKGGDTIPITRTRVAVEYKELFNKVGDLLKAVRPEDAKVLTHELATGLEGREETLRDLIGDTHQLTGTLADNAQLLDELSVRLTRLSEVLSGGGPALAGGLDGLATFTDALRASRQDLDGVLARGPQFLGNVQALLNNSRPGLRCLLSALAWKAPPVFDQDAKTQLKHALGLLNTQLPTVAKDVVRKEPRTGNPYANVTIAITVAGPVEAAQQYLKPAAPAVAPDLYYCKGNPGATKAEKKAGEKAQGSAGTAKSPAEPFTAVKAPTETGTRPASGTSAAGRWLPVLPIAVAALVLAFTVRRTLRVARRRPGR